MKKIHLLSTFSIVACMTIFASCFKDTTRYEPPQISAAGVAFINASPKSGPLDFVDYESYRILTGNLSYNHSVTYPVTDTQTTPYRAFYTGYRTFAVGQAGSSLFFSIKQFLLKPNKVYSFFAVDTAAQTTLLQVEDSIRSLDSNKVSIKFINLTPDAKKIALYLNNQQQPLFDDVTFKQVTTYITVDPGENNVLTVKELDPIHGNNATYTATRDNVSFVKGGVYTIWSRGLENANDSTKLNISIMRTR